MDVCKLLERERCNFDFEMVRVKFCHYYDCRKILLFNFKLKKILLATFDFSLKIHRSLFEFPIVFALIKVLLSSKELIY